MSLSSEQDLLSPILLKDFIMEMIRLSDKVEKAVGKNMTGKEWSDGIDSRDLENAKAEYEMQK